MQPEATSGLTIGPGVQPVVEPRRAPWDPEQVVLLAPDGHAIGTADKFAVHTASTPLHLAFSCYLFDEEGSLLLTRRALGKATWPGVWTNTCCGHPHPGEAPQTAVRRRLGQELGVRVEALRCALPDFAYRAVDASGIVENEICPVWVGRLPRDVGVTPDPAEVMDLAWIPWPDLVRTATAAPQLLSPWSVLQVLELATLGDDPVGPA